MAFGIATTGSSIGGTAVPIVSSNLIELIGYVKGRTCNKNTEGISVSNGQCESLL